MRTNTRIDEVMERQQQGLRWQMGVATALAAMTLLALLLLL